MAINSKCMSPGGINMGINQEMKPNSLKTIGGFD
jgi:hypothetical protein